MSLQILQKKSCAGTCTNCQKSRHSRVSCSGHNPCPGYDTGEKCPPLIVLAVVDHTLRMLATSPDSSLHNMRSTSR